MSDLSLEWGGDLGVSPSGDFAVATDDVLLRQQLVRALCTNPRVVLDNGTVLDPDCWMHPKYGAGLGRYVGKAFGSSGQDLTALEGVIRTALRSVDGVSQTQLAPIRMRIVQGGVRVIVAPVSAATNQPVQIGLFVPD